MITHTWTTFGRKQTLAGVALAAGLIWMIPGCIEESPIAFSPDGKTLAFVTVEPCGTENGFVIGPQAFRLMLLDDSKRIRVLEESTDTMLSSPAFSPDGKHLAYLRVALPTARQAERLKANFEERVQSLQKLADPVWLEWATGQKGASATQPAAAPQVQDQALPPFKSMYITTAMMMLSPNTTATLVVRNLQTGSILSTTPVEMPMSDRDSVYVSTRPQFDPSGRQVYFAAGNLVLAVDLTTGQKRIVGAGTGTASLSPDGRTLATIIDDAAGLVATDGDLAIFRRLPISPAGNPAWLDSQTVAVLQDKAKAASAATQPAAAQPVDIQAATTQEASPAALVIQRLRRDGTLLEPVEFALPREASSSGAINQLAVAPDGKHLVISLANGAIFATLNGKVLAYVENSQLQQPAFSPDSSRVAFKVFQRLEDKTKRTAAIAFFGPDGKELYRVPIAPIAPGATRPATQPAGQ